MRARLSQICLVSVDGTDFKINEPSPFDPAYYSHKLKHAGVRYEVCVCIMTGWIVWVHGPFPCGAWPDLRIARSALHDSLLADEMYIADGGYADGNGYGRTPNGLHDFEQRQYATVRAKHETRNSLFKKFGCMEEEWRHPREKHGMAFRAVAHLVQMGIMNDEFKWDLDYNEEEF
jgi:hypothetical protein